MRLKIGVVGCGMVSGYGHLPAIAASPDWTLLAVADVDAARLARTREQYAPAHACRDYRELVALPGLDAVVVATHLDTHHEITLAALAHGRHVLCEKPMAASLTQCREMVAAAAHAGRLLAINFNTRPGAIYREIKRLIDAGTVGPVRVVRFVYDWSAHQWQPPERLERFMANGGPIVDSGVHFFEGARWFTGQEIVDVSAHGVCLPPHEHPQHVIATCRLSGGAVALIEAGWLYCKRTQSQGSLFQIDVIGDDGAISYDATMAALRVYSRSATEQRAFTDEDKHFELVYAFLAESVRQGRLVELGSGEDGLKATEAALQALAAAKAG